MKPITVVGYLTQSKLESALRELVGNDWIGRELPVQGSRKRWDMAFRTARETVVIEYDGDEHYRSALKIKADLAKDADAERLGFRVVRIPFWVQLDTATVHHYFGLDAEVHSAFPHGFVTTPHLPASFCELGVRRFEREFDALPEGVREAVLRSLQEQSRKHGAEYALPSTLRGLLRRGDR
jgi:hypothetical protein